MSDHAVRSSPPRLPVVLTRPEGQNSTLAAALRAAGRQVLEAPALRLAPIDAALPDPADYPLVVFVSGNAVRLFLDTRADGGQALPWPAHTLAAVVGPSSAAALRAHPAFGPAPAIVQPPDHAASFDSEALWDCLQTLPTLPARALIVRGGAGPQGSGRDWLAQRLRQAGMVVDICQAYRRDPASWSLAQSSTVAEWVAQDQLAVWLFTSKEGVDATVAHLGASGWLAWWAACPMVATHARIAEHLQALIDTHATSRKQAMLLISSPQESGILAAIESTP